MDSKMPIDRKFGESEGTGKRRGNSVEYMKQRKYGFNEKIDFKRLRAQVHRLVPNVRFF